MAEAAASYRDWPGQGVALLHPGPACVQTSRHAAGPLGLTGPAWVWDLPGSKAWVKLFGSRACLGLGRLWAQSWPVSGGFGPRAGLCLGLAWVYQRFPGSRAALRLELGLGL